MGLASSNPTCLPTSSLPVFRSLPISTVFPTKVTDGTVLSAAWAMTLARHLGVRDTVFGLVSSGRSLETSASIRGPPYNFIPVRVDVGSHQTSTAALLHYVQEQIAASTEHDHVPFALIAEHMVWKDSALGSLVPAQDIDLTAEGEVELGGTRAKVHALNPGGESSGLVKAVSFWRGSTRCVGVVGNEKETKEMLPLFVESVETLCRGEAKEL